jgi:diaminopimelate epimerase
MRLTKHHGLGNDFLVALVAADGDPDAVSAELARHACDRHAGIGADGLLRGTRGTGSADVTMRLFNADGGIAEMSGNGIGCLAQAAVHSGLAVAPTVRVATAAGRRDVELRAVGDDGRHHDATVDMGVAKVGEDEPEWVSGEVIRAARVDIGNPHLVLHVADPDWDGPIDELGASINELVPGGINVEWITLGDDGGTITMRVYERGVGPTLACGTGACAAAAAAAAWELVGERSVVHMPGGAAVVELGETVRYTVPIVHVADVELPWP